MAYWQGVNINTGAVELPKYNDSGVTEAAYIVAVSTALANGDTLYGPVIPTGVWVDNIKVVPDKLDSAGSPAITFEAGFQNTATTAVAGFIATGNTSAQAGGVATLNVPAAFGTTFASNTTVIAVITAGAGTAVAGNVRLAATYTASP